MTSTIKLRVMVAGLAAASIGCGGDGGGSELASDDAHEVVDAWAKVACASNEVSAHYGSEAVAASETADLEASAQCVREDLSGTFQQKRQLIFVFNSDTAMDTYLSTRPCPLNSAICA